LGIEARQSIGWREWFSLELNGSYGGSLNGSGGGFPNAIPASLSLWDLGLEASTSIALDSVGSVYIEPSIGYGWLVANMRAAVALLPRKNWVRTDAYGPSAALYMRLFLTKRISVRFGSKYQASQLRTKSYASGRGSLPAGMLVDKRHSRARRHSLGALMGFDYAWRSWINLHAAVDYQSWSAGGAPQSMNRNYQFNDQATMAPRLERTRFTWGVDFAY